MYRAGIEGHADVDRTPHSSSESSSVHHRHADPMEGTSPRNPARRTRKPLASAPSFATCALLLATLPLTMAQNGCVSLARSTACPAFSAASVSTNRDIAGLFPFLSGVSDVSSFDTRIQQYIAGDFTRLRYQHLIGCSDVNLDNTTSFYARYTTSVLCNAIVQNSIEACRLSDQAIRPLCADSCADYAQSEQEISASSNICGTAGPNALSQIRADFTNCALPANSITGTCIAGVDNEGSNCGFSSNLSGLCSYCAASSPNATDSCCVFSNTSTRCQGVELAIIASQSLAPVTITATDMAGPTGNPQQSHHDKAGLSGGSIAAIVVGSILGALLLLALLVGACLLWRKRRAKSPATSIFNQPSPGRHHDPDMEFNDGTRDGSQRAGLVVPTGARVARMSALEGDDASSHHDAYTMGAFSKSHSDEESYSSPMLAPPRRIHARGGSFSSAEAASGGVALTDSSPSSGAAFSSPGSQGQSEQLNFFKDYYSQDEIRAGDLVSTLWAYEPRAADEFQLDRGDMIKVAGIWDDGWATGVRVRQRAEDWRPEDKVARDSGLSSAAGKGPEIADQGEIKAFPLVCVCLPEHWRKTIEGDSTEGSGPVFNGRGFTVM